MALLPSYGNRFRRLLRRGIAKLLAIPRSYSRRGGLDPAWSESMTSPAVLSLCLCLVATQREQIAEQLLELCELSAPSGHETLLQDSLEARLRELKGVEVKRDSIGNVVAFHGRGSPQRL